MKKCAFASLLALFVGFAGPGFAFDSFSVPTRAGLIQSVSCNVNDEDKQAHCMRNCEDEWIKSSAGYGAKDDPAKAKATRAECETKCGCPAAAK